MHPISKSLAALLVLAQLGALPAQTQQVVYYTDGSPTAGSRNAFPFGNNGIRYQTIVPNATFGNLPTVIRDILVAGTSTPMEIIYDDIEIKMGRTKQVTPTNNWNTNNPNPTTVYRGPLRVRFAVGKWGGLGLPNPYLFVPTAATDNLCVEVIVWKASNYRTGSFYFPLASGTAARAYAAGWVVSQTTTPATSLTSGCKMGFVVNNGNVAFAGTGCNSSFNTQLQIGASPWPQPGKPFVVNLSGARPNSLANLVLGLDHAKWGNVILPFHLGPLGAPNCFIWNDPLLRVPLVTDNNGAVSLTAILPTSAISGTVFAHWWVLDPAANAFQVTSSDYATIVLGN